MSTVISNEPRIRNVKVTMDAITACLVDGRVISVPLAWSCGFPLRLRPSVRISRSLAMAKEFTGLKSTRTSVLRGCFTGLPLVALGGRAGLSTYLNVDVPSHPTKGCTRIAGPLRGPAPGEP